MYRLKAHSSWPLAIYISLKETPSCGQVGVVETFSKRNLCEKFLASHLVGACDVDDLLGLRHTASNTDAKRNANLFILHFLHGILQLCTHKHNAELFLVKRVNFW
jgi:hypothetical protein